MKGMSSLHSSLTRGAETSCGKFWKRSQLCQCSKPLMLTAASGCKSCADGGAAMLHVSELLLAAPTAAIHGNTLCPGPRAGDPDPRCSHPARLVVGGYDDSVLLKTLEGGVEVAMEAGGDHGGLGRGDILDLANLCRLILRRVVLEIAGWLWIAGAPCAALRAATFSEISANSRSMSEQAPEGSCHPLHCHHRRLLTLHPAQHHSHRHEQQ